MPRPKPNRELEELLRSLFSDSEHESLVLAFARARGSRGFTADEAATLLSRAREAKLKETLVSLAIKGAMNLELDADGELVFLSIDGRPQ